MTFFLNSHSRSLRSNDNWPLNFEAATSKFGNLSCKFGSSPQGKVDLSMTNGSRVLIHLTLLYTWSLARAVFQVWQKSA